MRRFIFLLIGLLGVFGFGQQSLDVIFEKKFNWSGEKFVGLDKFDDLYYINQNVLYKTNDFQTWHFKDYNLGEIHQVDIINPLQILVFYKNFQTIIVLDNQLNEIRRIMISPENNFFIQHISLSIQNNMWFYDEKFQKFGLYDMQRKNWQNFPYILKHSPVFFYAQLNKMYWVDDRHDLYELSFFGQVNKMMSFDTKVVLHHVNENVIIYEKEGKFYLINMKDKNSLEIKIPIENFKNIVFKNQKMLIFTDTNFELYQIN